MDNMVELKQFYLITGEFRNEEKLELTNLGCWYEENPYIGTGWFFTSENKSLVFSYLLELDDWRKIKMSQSSLLSVIYDVEKDIELEDDVDNSKLFCCFKNL